MRWVCALGCNVGKATTFSSKADMVFLTQDVEMKRFRSSPPSTKFDVMCQINFGMTKKGILLSEKLWKFVAFLTLPSSAHHRTKRMRMQTLDAFWLKKIKYSMGMRFGSVCVCVYVYICMCVCIQFHVQFTLIQYCFSLSYFSALLFSHKKSVYLDIIWISLLLRLL